MAFGGLSRRCVLLLRAAGGGQLQELLGCAQERIPALRPRAGGRAGRRAGSRVRPGDDLPAAPAHPLSADKSPYKTYQGAFVERFAGTGFYVQVSAEGMLASGGFHSHGADQVERYRAAVDADRTGGQLASIVAALRRDGLAIGGDRGPGRAAVLGCPDGR